MIVRPKSRVYGLGVEPYLDTCFGIMLKELCTSLPNKLCGKSDLCNHMSGNCSFSMQYARRFVDMILRPTDNLPTAMFLPMSYFKTK